MHATHRGAPFYLCRDVCQVLLAFCLRIGSSAHNMRDHPLWRRDQEGVCLLAVGVIFLILPPLLSPCHARSDAPPVLPANVRWRERATLLGHDDQVTAVAFSPDEKMLASGGADSIVVLWDLAEGKKKRILKGQKDPISCLAFSPDGTRVASGSSGTNAKQQRNTGQIIVWDVATGEQCQTFNLGDKSGPVNSVSFSPDGTLLAASGDSGRPPAPGVDEAFGLASVWDVKTGKERATFGNGSSRFGKTIAFLPVTSVTFSPDGQALLLAGSDQLILWDWATLKTVVLPLQGGGKPNANVLEIFQFAIFHPGGKALATVHSSSGVKIWDVSKQVQLREFSTRAGYYQVPSIVFANDGKILVTAETLTETVTENQSKFNTSRSEVSLSGVETGEILLRLQTPTLVRSLTSSKTGKLIAVGCQGKIKMEIPQRPFTAEDVAAGRGPKIVGDKAGIVTIWELVP